MKNKVEKELLIDQIVTVAFDVYFKRDTIAEHYKNFTVYCNKETRIRLEEEMFENIESVNYIGNIAKKEYQDFDTSITVNGITLKFIVGEEYKILTIAFDTYPPLED